VPDGRSLDPFEVLFEHPNVAQCYQIQAFPRSNHVSGLLNQSFQVTKHIIPNFYLFLVMFQLKPWLFLHPQQGILILLFPHQENTKIFAMFPSFSPVGMVALRIRYHQVGHHQKVIPAKQTGVKEKIAEKNS
jgi:hypothetical protein